MTTEDRVLYYISSVRKRLGVNWKYYMNGRCYDFYFKLLGKFANALCYYNDDHIITKIEDKYYDITGEVKKTNHLLVDGKHYSHIQLRGKFNT